MGKPRYVCIHGHFYQPPRENPWLEAVEVQDSARPYHDWNERITRECYGPNTRSRLVDPEGKIVNLLNNYAWMSFNFGPTLLAWMDEGAPGVLAGILEGDRISRERHGGHGNALAQVYNHVIMPLAGDRDKHTQVAWGVTDFRRRFRREPEGMWLAETAVDLPTLEALAQAGLRFTILAPHQARRWRQRGEQTWTEIPSGIDPSRAYLCKLPSGRTINLFFYDGIISREVAFERLLDRGEKFLERLLQAFDDKRSHAELVHIATDGESYGHHHPFGDMALAYVLDRLRQHPDVRLTNYAEFLELHPPEWEVEIHENTSWSCAHGIERWRADCGCRMRGDWQQQWRGPLRQALDGLKVKLDLLFGTRGRECFTDPWAARDAYIDVIQDRSTESVRRFFKAQGYPDLDEDLLREGLWLLEMQRQGLLMFTSCGWFFDELTGLEPTQCLRYALRGLQLARHVGRDFEEEFLAELTKATSNLPQYANGRIVWEQLIRPSQVDLERVMAHQAISLIYRPDSPPASTYVYDLETLDHQVQSRGGNQVAFGRLRVRSRLTWDRAEASFVVIHYGGLDFYTALRQEQPGADYEEFRKKLLEAFQAGSLADVTALVTGQFQGDVHRLDDLFLEEQRRVIGIVLQDRFEDYQRSFERLANQDEGLLARLGQLHFPIPKPLRAAAAVFLDHHLQREITALETDGNPDHIRALCERGRSWGYEPEKDVLARALGEALNKIFHGVGLDADPPAVIAKASQLLDAAALLAVSVDLWQAQNQLLDAFARLASARDPTDAERQLFAALALKLNIRPSVLGWRP
jgi:alpha-amylase/alpha-mannosidase (GH57 family)